MSSATIERLGGLAALAGGMLITITALVGLVALDYENFDQTKEGRGAMPRSNTARTARG